jgi:hypothetical protein
VEVEEEDRRPTFLKSRTSSIRKEGVGTQILNVTTYQKVVGRIHWSSVTLDFLFATKEKNFQVTKDSKNDIYNRNKLQSKISVRRFLTPGLFPVTEMNA